MTHHLVGATEIAAMLSVSRQRVHQLAKDDPEFPEPAVVLSAGGVWEREAIERWAHKVGRAFDPEPPP